MTPADGTTRWNARDYREHSSAQAAWARGDVKTARELAARAKTRFPTGSPGWVRADDIVTYKPPTRHD